MRRLVHDCWMPFPAHVSSSLGGMLPPLYEPTGHDQQVVTTRIAHLRTRAEAAGAKG